MQTAEEQNQLVLQIIATAETIGQVLSGAAAALMAEDLEGYPYAACCAALKKCRAEVRGRLTPHDVVSRLNAADGRPGRDEAWSIALQSADERATVVWTSEIMCAYDAAKAVLRVGDKVGARMAFLSAYDRLVESARAQLKPAHWIASYGWDGELRQLALEEAVKLQRLPLDRAKLLGYEEGPVTAEGKAIAGLLTGGGSEKLLKLTTDVQTRKALQEEQQRAAPGEPSPEFKERLNNLRHEIAQSSKLREEERDAWIAAEAEELARKKRAMQAAVDERLGGAA